MQSKAINAKIKALEEAVTALQKENYSLKAKVFDLEKQIYLMNYKPKRNEQQENIQRNQGVSPQ